MDMSFLGGDPPDDAQPDAVSAAYVAPDDHPGTDPTSPDDHLWMHQDGRIWDLGPAELDTDDDGVSDSLTRNGPDGLSVYTDTDRDGQVDRITEVDARGEFTSSSLDPTSGNWVPTDSGRLD